MFKVGKIKQLPNEKVKIKKVKHEVVHFEKGKKNSKDIEVLSFAVYSDDYSFEFMMKDSLNSLLDIPMGESIDFKDYLFMGETFFNIKDKSSYMDPSMDIRIYRYLESSYEITIHFDTNELNSMVDYSGFVQFSFDLNDYLDK